MRARITRKYEAFKKANKQLIIVVADSSGNAYEIYENYNLKWATFILDEFKSSTSKMSPNRTSKGISLPKTFVLDSKGVVQLIIGQEGYDFVDLLLK